MGFIIVDVEADGPCPGLYSMVCFGAVELNNINNTFYGETKPITEEYIPDALRVSGFSRKQHESFCDPFDTMSRFKTWLNDIEGRPVFISDNPAFDWQWINYYFHNYTGNNPFGFSARRIGDLYSGFKRNAFKANEWKRLRKTKHTHNPVDDAKGNAEALLAIKGMGLRM